MVNRGARSYALTLSFVLLPSLFAPPAAASEPPQVEFDLACAIDCEEVTPAAFAALHPEEKVIQAVFRVSVRLIAGEESALEELVIDITSPEQRLRVLDFSPDTQLESLTTGTVEISKTSETMQAIGAKLGGDINLPTWPIDAHLSPGGDLGRTKRDVVTEKVEKISPQYAVLTSGTTHQGYGVFFKLKRSLHGSFEGVHEFACKLIVPREWRGDWVLVACQARGLRTKYFVKSSGPCGQDTASVGLYLAGDRQAKEAAFALAHAQGHAGAMLCHDKPAVDPLTKFSHLVSDATALLAGAESNHDRCQAQKHHLARVRKTLARFAGD